MRKSQWAPCSPWIPLKIFNFCINQVFWVDYQVDESFTVCLRRGRVPTPSKKHQLICHDRGKDPSERRARTASGRWRGASPRCSGCEGSSHRSRGSFLQWRRSGASPRTGSHLHPPWSPNTQRNSCSEVKTSGPCEDLFHTRESTAACMWGWMTSFHSIFSSSNATSVSRPGVPNTSIPLTGRSHR